MKKYVNITKFKRAINVSIIMYTIFISIILIFGIKILTLKTQYANNVSKIKTTYDKQLKGLKVYKSLYENNEKELLVTNRNLDSVNKEYKQFKETVAINKQQEKTLSRGGDYDISKFPPITKDELNTWIKKKCPSNSPFIGRADVFIKASKESGLDPKFIVALAGLESGYGTSQIAKDKGNFFGIAAYNASPYDSSKSFDGGLEGGIVNGAKFIASNYINKNGTISINSMQYGNKTYCQTDDGNVNPIWERQLISIMND